MRGSAARLFVWRRPSVRPEPLGAQHELSCADRQKRCDHHRERSGDRTSGQPADSPSRQREEDTDCCQADSDDGFNERVPSPGQEERGQEVPVEPFLIGSEGAGQERATDGCDRDLGYHTRQAFGPALSTHRGQDGFNAPEHMLMSIC